MWHVTVAAIIEWQNKFLCVMDETADGIKLNQPAGHLNPHEDILTAITREVAEETSLQFIPHAIVGIYTYHTANKDDYLRICFSGMIQDYSISAKPSAKETEVIDVAWYSLSQIQEQQAIWRSPLVGRCLKDYLADKHYPLTILNDLTLDL